ncbi:galactosylceramide sulfotransferase-like [Conger conger]|uniref:galactosylceramide sulfotransferase-like n=1 Tax=Conger conger TaxID=82655 RepID=UPI002A5A3AB4|nr:galactosylceramide sulfotransferase-like [Conger conger]
MAVRCQRQCRSLGRRLLLGVLLTSLSVLLYSLSALTHQRHPQEMVPPSCAQHPPPEQEPPLSNTSLGPARACRPKVDIMFLKTHKTASSTLLNILFRFGEKHGLRFALPHGRNDFFYPQPFVRWRVEGYQQGLCFNIVCNHMRFDAAEVGRLLPPHAAYITILRDPAHVFESSFHYYGRLVPLTWTIPGRDKMAEFLRQPRRYYRPAGYNAFYLRNLLLFDLGYDHTLGPEDSRLGPAIRHIEQRFQLVLLAEHFEESLVLLRHALCWEVEDLQFFRLNARRPAAVSRLSAEQRERARRWNGADWRLYRHFNASFWARVEAFGPARMEREVQELQERNRRMADACIEGGVAVGRGSIRDAYMQPWQPVGESSILGYNLRRDVDEAQRLLCLRMLTPEIQYLSLLGGDLWITHLWAHIRQLINW